MESKQKKKFLSFIPAIIVMLAIFWFSNQPADTSTEMSDGVTKLLLMIADCLHLLEIQSVDVPGICEFLSFPIRKCAHMTEYLILYGTLIFGLFHRGLRDKHLFYRGLLFTFIYACTDEFHQLFIPGRACRVTDVMIDCFLVLIVTIILSKRRKRGK